MSRNSASTRARKKGYTVLLSLSSLLTDLFNIGDAEMWKGGIGWRDYMHRHTPTNKRGGPDKQPSRRKKQKNRDRTNTIR